MARAFSAAQAGGRDESYSLATMRALVTWAAPIPTDGPLGFQHLFTNVLLR